MLFFHNLGASRLLWPWNLVTYRPGKGELVFASAPHSGGFVVSSSKRTMNSFVTGLGLGFLTGGDTAEAEETTPRDEDTSDGLSLPVDTTTRDHDDGLGGVVDAQDEASGGNSGWGLLGSALSAVKQTSAYVCLFVAPLSSVDGVSVLNIGVIARLCAGLPCHLQPCGCVGCQ